MVAKGIELVVAILQGDGRGAWAAFLGMFVEFGYGAKELMIKIGYAVWWVNQQIALAVATAIGDVESIKRITDDLAAGKTQYEFEIKLNEESKKGVDNYLDNLKRGGQSATESTDTAKDKIAEYDTQLQAAKQSATDLSKTTADQVHASTDAITKALAETPTTDAATQLGADLMAGFSQGISDNAAMVMNALGDSVLAGKDGAVSAAKEVATEAKNSVLKIVKNDLFDEINKAFFKLSEDLHFNFAYMLGGVRKDIDAMVEEVRRALAKIPTNLGINVNVNYTTSGSAEFPTIGGRAPELQRGGIIHAAAGGGGFSTGQLFIAREAGPEIVAGIGGGRTAVMNNNQIVESVSNGVYQAVVDAMNSTARGETGDFVVNVDGQTLLRIMRKAERSAGYQLSTNPTFA